MGSAITYQHLITRGGTLGQLSTLAYLLLQRRVYEVVKLVQTCVAGNIADAQISVPRGEVATCADAAVAHLDLEQVTLGLRARKGHESARIQLLC